MPQPEAFVGVPNPEVLEQRLELDTPLWDALVM